MPSPIGTTVQQVVHYQYTHSTSEQNFSTRNVDFIRKQIKISNKAIYTSCTGSPYVEVLYYVQSETIKLHTNEIGVAMFDLRRAQY